jgi:hypothetical protein
MLLISTDNRGRFQLAGWPRPAFRPACGATCGGRFPTGGEDERLETDEFFFLLATGSGFVQIIPVEAAYAVVASSYRGLVVLRCCHMQDSGVNEGMLAQRAFRPPGEALE